MSDFLPGFADDTTSPEHAAIRAISRVMDTIKADHDRALHALSKGGTFQEMRDMVTTARIQDETLRGLKKAIESIRQEGRDDDQV